MMILNSSIGSNSNNLSLIAAALGYNGGERNTDIKVLEYSD